MLLRPQIEDIKNIGYYSGKIVFGVGLTMLIPLFTALALKEWDPAFDFVLGMLVCFVIGFALQFFCFIKRRLTWVQGLVVVVFSWLMAMLLGAVPHYLSGHFGSFLDACFDLMSGYTTTGLYLLQDLDHISGSLNMWRHLLSFIGGQGIIVIALTFISGGMGGALAMYVGEGKEEKLLPHVAKTAQVIWLISLIYLAIGTLALWLICILEGITLGRGFLHGLWISMAAWSTGGFAPQSYNVGYYHSLIFELVTLALFIIGSFNFALHFAVWTNNRKEIYKNIEIVSFSVTLMIIFVLALVGLMRVEIYPDAMAFFRKAFYHVISGHTTTGFMTLYSRQLVREWGDLAMLAIIITMVIGGSACSTSGGIKGLRIGIAFKALLQDIKKIILPKSVIVIQKYHHIKDVILEEKHVRAIMTIIISFIAMHLITTLVGVYCGYPLIEAMFDAISAGSNTGLSCGVISPTMPDLMKIIFIVAMWAGRLEFIALFALAGFIASIIRGK